MLRKIINFSLLIIAVLYSNMSCKQIPHEIETKFTVDIPAQQIIIKSDGYIFSGSAIFDPNLNIDTKDWNITNLSFGEIRLIVKDANILDWLIAAQIQIIITDNTTNESIAQLIPGYHSLYPSNSILLNTNDADHEFLRTLIIQKHTATFEISGLANQSNTDLVFTYSMQAFASIVR